VYAFNAASGEPAWEYSHPDEALCLSDILFHEGVFYTGSESGQIAALPWHFGQYCWAAEALEPQSRVPEAAEAYALAAFFETNAEIRAQCYRQAAACWLRAGQAEYAAALWDWLEDDLQAAAAWALAGDRWRLEDSKRAVADYQRAAERFFHLGKPAELNTVNRKAAQCANLPFIEFSRFGDGDLEQWESGDVGIRLYNRSQATMPGRLVGQVGGGLVNIYEFRIDDPLPPHKYWTIPIKVTPTREQTTLRLEFSYPTGQENFPTLHGLLIIELQAVTRPKPVQFGDIGFLHLTIAGATEEGVQITTRDIGMLKTQGAVGSVKAEGDLGFAKGSA
jgi:hypothetical protein